HRQRVLAVRVDGEERARERVLGAAAVARRAEARVAPRPRPLRGRIDLGAGRRLLVTDERPVTRARAVDALLPPDLPEDLVPAEERQVHARVAGRRHVRPLAARPVLVVAGRQEELVLEDLATAPVA